MLKLLFLLCFITIQTDTEANLSNLQPNRDIFDSLHGVDLEEDVKNHTNPPPLPNLKPEISKSSKILEENPKIEPKSHTETPQDHVKDHDDHAEMHLEHEPYSVNDSSHHEHHKKHEAHGVKVADFKFSYVKAELVLAVFIVLIGIFKLVYHQWKYLAKLVPESCCLIVMGLLLGLFFLWSDHPGDSVKFLEFDSKVFFFFLLPPIMLESAYSLNDKAFVDNLGTIILYAVVGTILNIAIIGSFLILFGIMGIDGFGIHVLDCLLFASLIAAVDPVAVLAIFKEVGVNKMLYFMVFGESLLNDAVTVVCYNLVGEFRELDAVTITDGILGILAFLCVSGGGLIIGLIFGLISTYITKFTHHVRVVEPVVVFGMAYLAFVFSELFHFSGIISIISCGLFQTHYTMGNLSAKSFISIMYITKVVSSVSESLIFIVLGVMLVNERSWFWDDWHPMFSLYSLILCIFARVVVVFFLTYIVNQFTGGVRYISLQEQIIMSYGGLRGAVSFCLAFMIGNENETKATLLSATYIVILFTVFFQGATIKYLVKYLNIHLDKTETHYRLFCEFNKGMVNYMTQGMEDLLGAKDHSFMRVVGNFSKKYMRPYLQRDYTEKKAGDKLMMIENEETIKEKLKTVPSNPSFKRQQTIDEMAEEGGVDHVDLIDEHDELMNKKSESAKERRRKLKRLQTKERTSKELEKEIDELTRDPLNIRALVNHEIYPDRNLVDEEMHERRAMLAKNRLNEIHMMSRLGDFSETYRKKSLFGKKKEVQKKSTSKGILAISAAGLGVSSHQGGSRAGSSTNLENMVIEEVDETEEVEPHSNGGIHMSSGNPGSNFLRVPGEDEVRHPLLEEHGKS